MDSKLEPPSEFQQVAALVCVWFDLLQNLSKNARTLEDLQFHVAHYHGMKVKATTDPAWREQQYSITNSLFGLKTK